VLRSLPGFVSFIRLFGGVAATLYVYCNSLKAPDRAEAERLAYPAISEAEGAAALLSK
jgi:hypothetical protein